MKTFEIKKIEDQDNICLVLSKSYINPIDDLGLIEKELRQGFVGKVIFDLMLSNGNSSNRFMEAMFDGQKFDYSSFKITDVDMRIKKISAGYYQENPHLLEGNYVLSNASKFLLKKGKVL